MGMLLLTMASYRQSKILELGYSFVIHTDHAIDLLDTKPVESI